MSRLSLCLSSVILAVSTGLCAVACDSVDCACQHVTHSHHNGCWVATSASFRVCSFTSAIQAEEVAKVCEHLRATLAKTHGLKPAADQWTPKCEVFLFVNKRKYGAVVGRQMMGTLGSSLVTPNKGEIRSRRIDLRTDIPNCWQEVLPHELTHVLIADHYRDGPPPLWYDEGLALLSDSQAKQSLHLRDLRHGINRGAVFSLSKLLTTESYPTPNRVSVFYGQCAAVARYLQQLGPAEKVHEFARRTQEIGVNLALRESYGIDGVAELESMWRKSLDARATLTPARRSLDKEFE